MDRALPNPAYIASLAPENFEDAKRLVALVPAKANAIEYRLDLAAGRISARALLELDSRCPIVTYRTAREGGKFPGSPDEYRRSVRSAYDAGAAVDVELESGLLDDSSFLPDRKRVIGSRHAAGEITEAAVDRFAGTAAAAIKLVRTEARSIRDGAACVAIAKARSSGRPFACFATGRSAAFSRILAPRFGSALAYGSVEASTADGQISLRELFEDFGIDRAGTVEKIFGVYGGDVSKSLSPRIHNALFARRGLPFLYLPLSASEGGAPEGRTLVRDLAALGEAGLLPAGLSITNPFKAAFESIVEAIDEDDAVARTGAANTIVRVESESGGPRFVARNTDAGAILEILSARGLAGRRVAILGNGGAARAAAYAAGQAGCEVSVAGRDFQRVKAIADRFGANALAPGDLPGIDPDVLINATPLGSGDDSVPFPAALLERVPAVVDFAYRSVGETPLVREARQRGCDVADGLEVLARQAVGQAKLFGVPDATFQEIDSILRAPR